MQIADIRQRRRISTIGSGEGVNVTAELWDASEDELGELRAGTAAALQATGFEVHEAPSGIYVPRGGLEDAEPSIRLRRLTSGV